MTYDEYSAEWLTALALRLALVPPVDAAPTDPPDLPDNASGLEREFAQAWRLFARHAPAYVCEHRFHAPRRWRFDFAWPAYRVALELEGATFARGRHTRGAGFAKDAEKYNQAVLDGWMVLRYTSEMLRANPADVVAQVVQAIGRARARAA